jgi:diguanylate cyclase (GGDEF)-like protein
MAFGTIGTWNSDIRRLMRRLELRKRHERDLIVLVLAPVVFFILATTTGVLDQFPVLTHSHEVIDALLLAFVVAAVGTAVYAYRRISDINREAEYRRQAQAQAHSFARHDPLTGLPNRGFYTERLQSVLYRLPPGRFAAVIVFEILGLRLVNDARGQYGGDIALIEIAEGLTHIVSSDMLFARMGGDNFAIVIPDMESVEEAARLARVVAGAIGRASFAGDTAGSLAACVGVAIAPDEGLDADTLTRRAELAMERAMRTGRSSICFYTKEMDAHIERRGEIERALRAEIYGTSIVPHYQPLVALDGDRVIGFEALARWNSPTVGPVTPDVFISVAEECGLIQELGDRLLRQACRDAVEWPDDTILAFNLSPRQLKDPALALRILAVLRDTGLPPRRLEIEITESAFVGDITLARKIIEELRSVGVHIALDDFGTGYATLSQLISLHFDKIKIDRSFIRRLGQDTDSDVIVKAVIGLARGLGLITLAEGVESTSQHGSLRDAGCMQGQGYLFGKAMPASEAAALVGTRAPSKVTA